MRISDKERQHIVDYLAAGNSIIQTATKFGRARSTIREIRNDRLPSENVARKGYKSRIEYVPTPEDIRLGCEVALAKRRPVQEKPYELPVYGSYCGKGGARIFQEVG